MSVVSSKIKEKYKLYLKWDKAVIQQDRLALVGANFSGPATKDMLKLVENDFILLDLTAQCFPVVGTFFIMKFSWGRVQYQLEKIDLFSACFHTLDIKKHLDLFDDDYMLIDTSNHEPLEHGKNLTYKTTVYDAYHNLAVFER